ncbi:hypothetical protein ACFL6C_07365 [Myxococcota bacterium]
MGVDVKAATNKPVAREANTQPVGLPNADNASELLDTAPEGFELTSGNETTQSYDPEEALRALKVRSGAIKDAQEIFDKGLADQDPDESFFPRLVEWVEAAEARQVPLTELGRAPETADKLTAWLEDARESSHGRLSCRCT